MHKHVHTHMHMNMHMHMHVHMHVRISVARWGPKGYRRDGALVHGVVHALVDHLLVESLEQAAHKHWLLARSIEAALLERRLEHHHHRLAEPRLAPLTVPVRLCALLWPLTAH